MKRIIISLTFYCFTFFTVCSQKAIELDFSTKSYTRTIDEIDKGDLFYIIIKNINLNIFKVQIGTRDTVLGKALETPVFGNFNLEAISKLVPGIASTGSSPVASITSNGKDTINTRLREERIKLRRFSQDYISLAYRIEKIKNDVYSIRLNSIKLDNRGIIFNTEDINLRISFLRRNLMLLQTEISIKKNNYEKFALDNKDYLTQKKDLGEANKSIKDSYDKLDSLITSAVGSISADKAYELLLPLISIENNVSNTYVSLPYQFNGDQAKVNISIVPVDVKYNLPSYQTQYVFPKINTYTVIGLSFYFSNLADDVFYPLETDIDDSTTTYTIKKEDTSESELGISTLLRYGKKISANKFFGIHLSLGAGISISDKVKPRFLFGGGFSFGKRHIFAIDGGIVAGNVDRLSSQYFLDGTTTTKPENYTTSTMEFGQFFALGYTYHF